MGTPAVDQVLATVGVQFAYLFGSRATGRHRPTSDADIRLVHVYAEIDDIRVHEALATGLPDLGRIRTAVTRLVS